MLQPAKQQYDPIDPIWLLKAVAVVILAALVCGYLTLCLLFYQGQWQFVLHPTGTPAALTTLATLPAQPIRFDAAASGTPRLSGALLPAPPDARYAAYTILYLRDGSASLSQSAVDTRNLTVLHSLGLNVFAFDYRGFGQSDPVHPTQSRMTEDTNAALAYLRDVRSITENHIVLFGVGTGASLAATLAASHPTIPAAIFTPNPKSPLAEVLTDPRVRFLPVRTLFHETFSLDALATLPTPKLILLPTAHSTPRDLLPPIATPKFTLDYKEGDSATLSTAISRFLDQDLPH